MTKEEIFKIVEEEDVEFIRLQFTDLYGMLKNIAITESQLERALENRCMFDGSAIEGFVRVEESDMYLHPDLNTFEILPWRPQQGKVARFICDVYRPDNTEFEGDPRYVLRRAIKKADDMGYTLMVGAECEFFLFHTDENGNPTTTTHERAGYFDVAPLDLSENVRRDIVLNLESMGYEIEASHHEIASAQHEIDFKYADALSAADEIMTFKMAAKTIAKKHGLHATFMPKPIPGQNGSGMHINMSLGDGKGKNLFVDEKDANGLSEIAYQFMAGLLKHIDEIAVLTNPLVNSYKRLIPGFDAPSSEVWSSNFNRSPLIRIPSQRGDDTRIELRCPDTAANPYFALAACLCAGLDGIKNKMVPPESVNDNLFLISPEEMKKRGIKLLPETLGEALTYFENSDFAKEVMGSHAFWKYLEAKKDEWKRFRTAVTDWEISEYLYKI